MVFCAAINCRNNSKSKMSTFKFPDNPKLRKEWLIKLRQRLHERGFTSTRFHDFETASKSMRLGSVYTEPFSPENPSRDVFV